MGDARPSNSRGDEHRSRGNSIGGFVGREGGGGRWDRRDSWGEDRDRFARHDRGGGGGGNRRLCERELDSDWKCLEVR